MEVPGNVIRAPLVSAVSPQVTGVTYTQAAGFNFGVPFRNAGLDINTQIQSASTLKGKICVYIFDISVLLLCYVIINSML